MLRTSAEALGEGASDGIRYRTNNDTHFGD